MMELLSRVKLLNTHPCSSLLKFHDQIWDLVWIFWVFLNFSEHIPQFWDFQGPLFWEVVRIFLFDFTITFHASMLMRVHEIQQFFCKKKNFHDFWPIFGPKNDEKSKKIEKFKLLKILSLLKGNSACTIRVDLRRSDAKKMKIDEVNDWRAPLSVPRFYWLCQLSGWKAIFFWCR